MRSAKSEAMHNTALWVFFEHLTKDQTTGITPYMNAGFFVTGTDTEIGKTTVAAGLLHAARQKGYSTAAVKPVASDCQLTETGLRNGDALALQAECTLSLTYHQINPFAFAPPIAPHLAACDQGVSLSVEGLRVPVQQVLNLSAELTLVEGAGGWHVPLNEQECLSDLAQQLQLPVILVVGIRLGCINHALLTAHAIQAAGLVLAGWVANQVAPEVLRLPEVIHTLEQRISAPCLGKIPYLKPATAQAVAPHLNLEPLFA